MRFELKVLGKHLGSRDIGVAEFDVESEFALLRLGQGIDHAESIPRKKSR